MQEKTAAQIASVIHDVLKPGGVAVLIEAKHMCMAMRGIRKVGSTTLTSAFTGVFHEDAAARSRFLSMVHAGPVR